MQHGAFPLVKPDPELLAIRSAFQLLPQNLVVRVVKIQAADTVTPVIPVRIGVKSGAQAAAQYHAVHRADLMLFLVTKRSRRIFLRSRTRLRSQVFRSSPARFPHFHAVPSFLLESSRLRQACFFQGMYFILSILCDGYLNFS